MDVFSGTAPLPHDGWETIIEYGADIPISTLASLLDFTNYGNLFRAFCAHVYNQDNVATLTLYGDVSHGAVVANDEYHQEKEVLANKEGCIIVEQPNPFTYVRFQAQSSVGTVQVKFALLGLRR